MTYPRGHLAAIRRMARELNRWCERDLVSTAGLFWYNGLAYNAASVRLGGELWVGLFDSKTWWTQVYLATARFTDHKGNDLMAIQ